MQTRAFDLTPDIVMQKAVLNLLQDEGFVIQSSQPSLGLFASEKMDPIPFKPFVPKRKPKKTVEIRTGANPKDTTSRKVKVLVFEEDDDVEPPPPPPIPVAKRTDLTVNITTNAKTSYVRFSAQRSVLSDKGGMISVEQILDSQFYQNLFIRLDKSLFLQRTGF